MIEGILKKGQKVTIPLKGNPSTGCLWELIPDDGYTLVDEVYQDDASEDEAAEKAVGSPGTQVFTIESNTDEAFTVKANYRRPFDADNIIKTVVFSFND
jgi:predicted secreted protein